MRCLPPVSVLGLALGVSVASATVVQDNGSYTITYDESTSFGFLSGSFTAADQNGATAGFHWDVPSSVFVTSGGTSVAQRFALPSFTITAKPGWTLANPKAFIGNLVFVEVGGAFTFAMLTGYAEVDHTPLPPVLLPVARVATATPPGSVIGYFGETYGPAPVSFTSLTFLAGALTLGASGGVYGAIAAQPQNRLQLSFSTLPVPEPETYAMLLAGMGLLGWLGRRRAG